VALLILSWALADFYLKKKKPKFISLMVLPLVNVLLILLYYLDLVFPRHAIWLIFYSILMVLCMLIALKLMYLDIDFLDSSACFWSQKLIDHIMYCIFFSADLIANIDCIAVYIHNVLHFFLQT
jgi:hypothetical protein